MGELTQEDNDAAATGSTRAVRFGGAGRRLCVMRSGARLFAVYADEVEAWSEVSRPTPLPFAPPPVRGVASQRGRILTVIDPLLLLTPRESPAAATADAQLPAPPPARETPATLIVALRGDEQLALSVERIEHDIELYDDGSEPDPSQPPEAPHGSPLLRRTLPHPTGTVALLDTTHLFEAAMQGVDRRRKRQ